MCTFSMKRPLFFNLQNRLGSNKIYHHLKLRSDPERHPVLRSSLRQNTQKTNTLRSGQDGKKTTKEQFSISKLTAILTFPSCRTLSDEEFESLGLFCDLYGVDSSNSSNESIGMNIRQCQFPIHKQNNAYSKKTFIWGQNVPRCLWMESNVE